jgi:hypothetical protein
MPTLPGIAQAAAGGLLGFDTDGIVTLAEARGFFGGGFRYCIRYVSRVAKSGPHDLSTAEALGLLNAGLALMPVQHVRAQGWVPSSELGASDGVHAAYHAFVIGFPPGVNVWCDLEGVGEGTPEQQVIDYCNSWYDAVVPAGYVPGLYVGADAILDGHALRFRLKFAHYWRSLSNVPDIEGRGYQMVQHEEQIANDISIERDVTRIDLLGDSVFWLAPIPDGPRT